MQGESHKNRDIEVLRAIAITYVIALHWVPHFLGRFGSVAGIMERYTALWSGVDLFFCISGYVIASSLLREAGPQTTIRNLAFPFWIRRIFRLWPSAWLWALLAVMLAAATSHGYGLFEATAPVASDAAAAILNVANFHYYHCLAAQSCGSLTVYWSLSLEEQFYWIFPLLLLVLPRRALVAVLIAIAAIQIALPRPNSFTTVQPSLLWLVRTDAICLGILLALFEPQGKTAALPSFVGTPLRARLVSFALMIVLAIAAAPALDFPLATGVLALASSGLVWLARFDSGLILPKTRFDPVLLWIGSRSYSLYLIHPVSGRLATEVRDRSVLLVPHLSAPLVVLIGVSLTIGLTLGFAELNFRFLETPLRKIGTRITRGQALRRTQSAGAPAVLDTI